MQDPNKGVDRTIKDDDVKDDPSYTPSCLWRRTEKMEFAQKTSYYFRFPVCFSFSPRGLYSEIRITILWIM